MMTTEDLAIEHNWLGYLMIAFMELQALFESNMFESEDEGVVIAFCISLLPNAACSESELEH